MACFALVAVASRAQVEIVFTNLVQFDGTNGASPYAGLVQGSDGNFYGTTSFVVGSPLGYGTVFRMAPDGTLDTLYTFTNANASVGAVPEAPLTQGADGNFYGTAQGGGAYGHGAIFRIDTNGTITPLVSFQQTNGANIQAGLVQGTDSNFYGTAVDGGMNTTTHQPLTQAGTVFKMTLTGSLSVLHYFGNPPQVGTLPGTALTQGKDGFLYGTALSPGTVFQISTNGAFTTLALFTGGTNGSVPENQLIQASDGNFYGKTQAGGIYGWGTLYRVAVSGTNGTLTTLIPFDGTNGAEEYGPTIIDNGPLVQGTDGNLYGTTICGGPSFDSSIHNYGNGTLFRLTTNGTLSTLYSFSGGGDGRYPVGGLTQGTDGNFYGMTYGGGAFGAGTIFRLSVPMPSIFQKVTIINSAIGLFWSAVAGRTYQVQYNTDLTSTNWTNLGDTITATNGTMSTSDALGSDQQRFYRVVLLP